jgi:hypothetical protein
MTDMLIRCKQFETETEVLENPSQNAGKHMGEQMALQTLGTSSEITKPSKLGEAL